MTQPHDKAGISPGKVGRIFQGSFEIFREIRTEINICVEMIKNVVENHTRLIFICKMITSHLYEDYLLFSDKQPSVKPGILRHYLGLDVINCYSNLGKSPH